MGVLLLVRHGQASFGSDDDDVLSPTGHRQAEALGRALADHGARVDRIVTGTLRRQRDSATALADAAGWDLSVAHDDRWDEFDHEAVLARHHPQFATPATGRAFLAAQPDPAAAYQRSFAEAVHAWSGDDRSPADASPAAQEVESHGAFVNRVRSALTDLATAAGNGTGAGSTLVLTSGGVIAAIVADLVGAPGSWQRLNTVTVNTGVSKVLLGRRGPVLSTFNEHGHLEHDRSLITYR